MSFPAEAQIARELMKFAANGMLYRGSKPVMWSVVEKTALADAEVEYEDYTSDTGWVKFPIAEVELASGKDAAFAIVQAASEASIVIWTTTPWTLPGNRAISYSSRIGYGLYRVTESPADNWAKSGDLLILADALAETVFKQARVASYERVGEVPAAALATMECGHPLAGFAEGYGFRVPLLEGEHVTADAGTGFVHTAPGHGREDFDIWTASARALEARGINTTIPYTVDENGAFTDQAPGFTGKRVINDKGEKGDANEAVIRALIDVGMLLARGRLKHQYPHSWRSKKPIIFRNTPQWFISMQDGDPNGLRATARRAIDVTKFFPPSGQNRLRGMIEARPDWVISRQRAWGVPIAVFVNKATGEVLKDEAINTRIVETSEKEGADAWFAPGAAERFLGRASNEWEKIDDILDVWFESGSTHAFVLEQRPDLKWPADVYLEGSDQHRGWFHSSLLESCGTRGRAPYDQLITHGFTMAEDGRKMSKSLGNQTFPQDVIKQSGADILRLWVASSDYADDQRIGPEILKTNVENYRKLRNTLRYILGALAGFEDHERLPRQRMPELERYVLHRLFELHALIVKAYEEYDFKRVCAELQTFMTPGLSAFYFDIRKDSLYCDPFSSDR